MKREEGKECKYKTDSIEVLNKTCAIKQQNGHSKERKKKHIELLVSVWVGWGEEITFLSELVGDLAHYTSFALQVGKVRNPCFKNKHLSVN